VTVGVEADLTWVAESQALTVSLTVGIVLGTTVDDEVGSFVDERSTPRIGTGGGGVPEGIAEVDGSELIGI